MVTNQDKIQHKILMKMTSLFRFLVIALFLSGCASFTTCEPNEQLLTCSDSSLTDCDGFLKDKSLIIESIEVIPNGKTQVQTS